MSSQLPLPTTSSRLLAMAVALVGSREKVERHMKFTDKELVDLLAGTRELTWDELDLLTNLLVDEQGHVLAQNHDLRELIRLRATSR
jgi:hypothetical protein